MAWLSPQLAVHFKTKGERNIYLMPGRSGETGERQEKAEQANNALAYYRWTTWDKKQLIHIQSGWVNTLFIQMKWNQMEFLFQVDRI